MIIRILITLFLLIVLILLILSIWSGKKRNSPDPNSSTDTNPPFKIIDDDSVTGKINPYFCYGNPFQSSGFKASAETRKLNSTTKYRVLGVGDTKGAGWQGGDSVGSIELSNGDLIFVFGDSFISKMQQPNVWLAYRDYNVQMPHNSISYMKLGKNKISSNTFFIGQDKTNLINDLGLGVYTNGCPFKTYDLANYKNDPMDFTPNGCDTLIQPSNVKTSSKNVSCWLYGGMNSKGDVALLAGNFVGITNVGFQFIEIKNAINKNALGLNPFLWDKLGKRHELPSHPDILWEKINRIQDTEEYLVYGGKNLHPGAEVYLLKGTYRQFLDRSYQLWDGGRWQATQDMTRQKPIVINDSKFVGPNYFSEFESSGKQYFFYGIAMNDDKKYVLYRYTSKNLTGPYDMDKSFIYSFPNWINTRSNELDCYNLRSHPGLARCFKVKSVLSYMCQGRYPQYSGYFFDSVYSAYNTYYPQFILIDY